MIKKFLIIVFIFISLFFFIYALKGEIFSNPFGLDITLNSSFQNITNITKAKKIVEGNTTTYIFEFKRQPSGRGINYVFVPSGKISKEIKKASDLVAAIPYSEGVGYIDQKKNKGIGYINLRGGMGKNFDIKRDTVYEIGVTKDVNWSISVEKV